MTKQDAQQKAPTKSNPTTWVVLAVTAVVIGVTIYVATNRPHTQPLVTNEPATPPNQADDVIAKSERLMATARRQPPAARTAAYEGARGLMQAWVQTHPDDVQVRPHLADLLLKMGRPDPALRVVDEMLALRPQSAEGLWLKGRCQRTLGKLDYAQFFDQAARSPDAGAAIWSRYGVELLGRQKYAEAETYLNKAYQAGAKDVNTLSGLARLALDRKRFEDAETYLAQASLDESAGPEVWWRLAAARKEIGKLDQAAEAVTEAIRLLPATAANPNYLGPGAGDMFLLLGQVRMLQKRTAEAGDAFTKAADDPLVRPQARFQAAQCWYLLGRYALALECIDSAEKLSPGDPAVAEWKKKIEDAHFSRPTTTSSPFTLP